MVYSTRSKTTCQLKKCLPNTALFSAIALVVLLFFLPTVVFLAFRGSGLSSWQERFSILSSFLDTCGSQSVRNNSNTSMSPGCTALPSTSTCYTHIEDLLESQVTSNNLSLMVSPRGNMDELQELEDLISDSRDLLTRRCRSTGLPLYCKFLFPPCFNGRVDPALQLTHSQCTSLVEDACQAEVTLLMPYLGYLRDRVSNLIPNCGTLQEDNTETLTGRVLDSTADNTDSAASDRSVNSTTMTAVQCHTSFVSICGLCFLSCQSFHLNSPLGTSYVDGVFLVTGTVLAIVGAVAFIVLSVFRRKDVFQFPTILVFYENMAELLVGVVLLLGQAIRSAKLFCSHPDVVRTVSNPPTFFCSFSGFVFQFGIGVILGCWVAQLVYMVILLHFPFFGERTLKKKKTYFHVVSLVVIISLSLIGPVVALARFNYRTIRFPTFICLSSNQDWAFYSFALPVSIFTATGAILCILLTRAVHKGLRSEASELKDRLSSKKKQFFSVPEVKLLILSVMLVVIGVVSLGRFSYIVATQDQYIRETLKYSTCQLRGSNPECVVETVIGNAHIATDILATIALTAVPFTNMAFPARYEDIVKMGNLLCCICRRKWKCYSRRTVATVQNAAPGVSLAVSQHKREHK